MPSLLGLISLSACASAPSTTAVDWTQVRVIEKNQEGMEHLALPKELPGCRYLGPVRASKPSEGDVGSAWIYESLKKKAARKGGDTIAVLPGGRAVAGTMRATVFRCGA